MLNEFAEREFSAEEMWEVLYTLRDIENDMRILRNHRKNGHIEFVFNDKRCLRQHVYELQEVLKGYALDYEANDLLDSEVLKELEDEQ